MNLELLLTLSLGLWFLPFIINLSGIKTFTEQRELLHPVLTRLLPLAFILPMVVHSIACGWLYLGGGEITEVAINSYQYTRALYWAISTLATVGYGDIIPKTIAQMLYASFTMVVGVGFFGYILSNVASLLSRLDAAKEHQAQTLDRVETFMRYNKIPPKLQNKVRGYFKYLWENQRGYSDSEILSQIPATLQIEITLAMNASIIEKVPFLKGGDENFIKDVVSKLEHKIALPEEKIFSFGDKGDAIYFIQKGQVEILASTGEVLARLNEGDFFGEAALVTNSPRNATVLSTGYCDLFVLKSESFNSVLLCHPRFSEHMKNAHKSRNSKAKKAA